jgi:hypothetical protein
MRRLWGTNAPEKSRRRWTILLTSCRGRDFCQGGPSSREHGLARAKVLSFARLRLPGNLFLQMPTLLLIDSGPLGEASIFRRLSGEFVLNWRRANPDDVVVRRDLTMSDLPIITAGWIRASFIPEASRSPALRDALSAKCARISSRRPSEADREGGVHGMRDQEVNDRDRPSPR